MFDADGDVTGNAGTILEKHIALSKASDATYSAGATSYWRKYSAESSEYIFAGGAPAGITTTGFTTGTFTKFPPILVGTKQHLEFSLVQQVINF